MLKKNITHVKFTRPASAMRQVLSAIEMGATNRKEAQDETELQRAQVESALKNLVYIGAVVRSQDGFGRSVYSVPGRQGPVAPCWAGVRSVFDVATSVQNQIVVNTRKD